MDMAYRITEEEYEEIKAAEKKTKDKRQSRQLKVLMLRYEGKSNPEISEKLDISTDRISHLISEFKRKGLGEYIKNKYKGNNRNMTYEEEEAILKRFSAAEEAGQIITVKEIKAAFDEKLGKDTKIKPRPKHPKKASEEEIAASKKLNPNWKKSS